MVSRVAPPTSFTNMWSETAPMKIQPTADVRIHASAVSASGAWFQAISQLAQNAAPSISRQLRRPSSRWGSRTKMQPAHAALVVHRDLKPSNILVTAERHVKLLDFGIAKLLDPESDDASTRAGALVLTPGYASPEQLRGEPITTATDVYQLGVLLFELLTDQLPHEAGRGAAAALRAEAELPRAPKPSSVAPGPLGRALAGVLDTIVGTALQAEPGNNMMPSITYNGWNYSTLDQITLANVADLQIAWTWQVGIQDQHEAPPLVVGDTMYIVSPKPNYVYALDLNRDGVIIWEFRPDMNVELATQQTCCGGQTRGIYYADILNTVSETYAREILSPEFGEGLDPLLRDRRDRLSGVLNGIDTQINDPASDPYIAAHYTAGNLAGKAACKRDLQREAGLPQNSTTPIIGAISRLADQKGFDLIDSIIEPLLPNKPRGVPRADDRKVLNGIYWRLRTGSPWAEIPEQGFDLHRLALDCKPEQNRLFQVGEPVKLFGQ